MGPQPVTGPAPSGGHTPVVVAQPQAGPPPAAGVVGTTHPHPGRPGSARSRFALSNWRVRWRLALLIAVPLLTAVVLGALTIAGDVSNWQAAGRVQHLAQLNSAVVKYIQAVEDERDYSVASTANRAGFSARLRTARRVTDGAAAEVAALADGITVGGGYQLVAVQAVNAVQVGEQTLPFVREAVADPLFPSAAIMQVYTVNVIQPANTFTSIVGNEASNTDTDLRSDVIALGALLQVEDSWSVQRALLLKAVSLPQPSLSPEDDASLQQAQRQEVVDLANFNASVDLAEQQNYSDTVSGPPVGRTGHEESLALALLPGASSAHPLTPANARILAEANVNDDMSFTVGKVRQVADELTGNISTLANTSRTNASTDLLVTSLVTLLLLLLVLLISILVARSLTRPLRKLRTDALDVAGRRLPEMVRRLSQSEGTDENVDIEPIGVTSTDEIGEVARAFDQVHREAVRLAADEAMLRGNLNAMFINLSRRSQSLIERQLSLIDSLEQSEQDPGRLSSLFRLDHLATRMRRNSENLLVLAGHEVTRRWSQPVPLVDVLRAAISEIEQYERVVLNVQPGIVVVGQAVNDVVHLIAEMVENATTFSPEDTQVYISGQPLSSGGVLLDITDTGVGISDQEMSHANWRLDNPPVVDVAVSRRMGLFVVGRLAARHGVRVRLRHAQVGGLTALIWLPDTVAAPEVAPALGRLTPLRGRRLRPGALPVRPAPGVRHGRAGHHGRAYSEVLANVAVGTAVSLLHPGRQRRHAGRRHAGSDRLRPDRGKRLGRQRLGPVASGAQGQRQRHDARQRRVRRRRGPDDPAAPRGVSRPWGPGSRAEQTARFRQAGPAGAPVPDRHPERPRRRRSQRGRPRGDQRPGERRPGPADRGRQGDGPAARHPRPAAADLRLARVRLVPPQRQDHEHGPVLGGGSGRPDGRAVIVDLAR